MSLLFLTSFSLLLVLNGHNIAAATPLEDLVASDEPVTYEQFLDAVTAAQRAEDARLCAEGQLKEQVCPTSPDSIVHEKAGQAYTAHLDRLDEQAFQRRQEEDAQDRARREVMIRGLFQKEYEEKLAALREDATIIGLPVGTALCTYPLNSPNWATVTEITDHRTSRVRLYTRTRRGDVEHGAGEVVVRKDPGDPHRFEIEVLSVTNEIGQIDLVPLGATKAVVLCADDAR